MTLNSVQETLRDTLAREAPNLGPLDIRDIMGWENDLLAGDPYDDEFVDVDDCDEPPVYIDSIYARWKELPLAKRLAVEARYRYAWADAMLRERDRTP